MRSDKGPPASRGPHERLATAIVELRNRQEEQVDRHQRLVERLPDWIGKPGTIYLIAAAIAGWTLYNGLASRLGWPAWDPPPFSGLQAVVGVLALLMTATVLATQKRQGRDAEQREQLDLQVNLLAEQKIAKLIALVEELRRDMPDVRDRHDSVAETMAEAADPGALIAAMEGQTPLQAAPSSSKPPEAFGRTAADEPEEREGERPRQSTEGAPGRRP